MLVPWATSDSAGWCSVSDARLRELERRWRETGAPEDEAAWLSERLRAGEVSAEQVELWAYCGRPGAALVMPQAATTLWCSDTLERWVHGLERWGRRPCVAAALGTLPGVWPLLKNGFLGAPHTGYRPLSAQVLQDLDAARELAEAWLSTPTDATRARVAEARALLRAPPPVPGLPDPLRRRNLVFGVLDRALDAVLGAGFAASAANCLNVAAQAAADPGRTAEVRRRVESLCL